LDFRQLILYIQTTEKISKETKILCRSAAKICAAAVISEKLRAEKSKRNLPRHFHKLNFFRLK
jgi:hypothetical protein